ncbi:hypothetical protein ACEWY4_007652 [Coilia grayii]|uniref:SCAN box domain-containing protein n=1 Tax=Coilia grayii TaxID=363190 RepID=A0ABD1KH23_9TELE
MRRGALQQPSNRKKVKQPADQGEPTSGPEHPEGEEERASSSEDDSSLGLEHLMRRFMQQQQEWDGRFEREMRAQDQRVRALQHQFSQLQTYVSSEPGDPVTVQAHYSHTPTPMAWAAPMMSPFTEDEDIKHYLTTFERMAMASQWPMDMWALYLVPLLTGKARAAYVAMDIRDAQDYDKVKRAILSKFEIDSETYRQRFRSRQVLEGETPRDLQARLRDLFEKWFCPHERSKEKVAELIILEQFLWMVNPELRTWIKEHNPPSATHAAELAETWTTRSPTGLYG